MFSYYYAGNYLTGFWAVKHLSKVLLPVRWLATEVGDTRSLFCDLGNNWNVHEWHLRGSRGARPRLVFFLIRSKESHMWATPGQPKINNLLSILVTSSSCGCLATKTIWMDYGGRKTFFFVWVWSCFMQPSFRRTQEEIGWWGGNVEIAAMKEDGTKKDKKIGRGCLCVFFFSFLSSQFWSLRVVKAKTHLGAFPHFFHQQKVDKSHPV